MSIKALGYSLKPEHYETIKKMVSVFTKEEAEILDLASFSCDVGSEDIVLFFGKKTLLKCSDKVLKARLEFPELDKLDKDTGRDELRKEAYDKLVSFKKIYDSNSFDKINDYKKELTETNQVMK